MEKVIEKQPTKLNEAYNAIIVDRYKEAFTYESEKFDRSLYAWLSQFIGWLSPIASHLAFSDWLDHLMSSPGRQLDIAVKAIQLNIQFSMYVIASLYNKNLDPCFYPRPNDHRFDNILWNEFPFNIYHQNFLMYELILDDLTSKVHGVSKHHHHYVNFMTRQLMDFFSPSNYILTNPEIIAATITQYGMNFLNGYFNLIEDTSRILNKQPPAGVEKFQVGKNVAISPGKVIYRNNLIELIQYEPTTPKVYAEPILFIPAWIMKYYILDLSVHNSMVKYLVGLGHTVFMISWKNPTRKDRDLSLVDYMNLGIISSIDVINDIVPQQKIHAVGYCIGGTLLMIAAAAMAKQSDHRLKTISLFAAQVDFIDAGELLLLVDEAQLNYIEDIMWSNGYLDGAQMAGTFSMLRATDLIFSRAIHDYFLGSRKPINDLMAWDNDTTRLPYKMHIEYLRKLFLSNDLVQGRFSVGGTNVFLSDVNVPIFSVSTQNDHVAPWRSVYKIHYFTNVDNIFVLASGGHNSGIIINPETKAKLSYQMLLHKKEDKHINPEIWQQKAIRYDGSWWPAWENWVASHSGNLVEPPLIGNPNKGYVAIHDAPGTFVFEK